MSKFLSSVEERYRYAKRGAKLWSVAYHGAGYLGLAAGAGATFVAGANLAALTSNKAMWTAGLAGFATLLGGMSTLGGFARKWRVNRSTRTALDRLRRDLEIEGETTALRARFEEILERHDVGIDGIGSSS